MKFLIGLVVGAVIAAAIGAGAIAVAFGEIDDVHLGDRDKTKDVTQTYDLTDFDEIKIAGVYELDVTVGPEFSVEIAGSEDEMSRVEAIVKDGVLVLDTADRKRGKHHWNNDGVTATISMPALNAVDVAGVVDGDISGVESEDFSVEISGVGDMDLEGKCGALVARVSGVGDLDAEDLICKSAKVRVSGVGSASVHASESVDASVSGMGEIDVSGSPAKVEKSGGLFSNISVH